METYVWSTAITILGTRGSQIANATEMPKAEAKRFISAVKDALKKLEKLRTGRRLLNEIDGSGHRCRIYCAPAGNDGAAQSDPMTIENNTKRLVKSFRPQYLNLMSKRQLPNDAVQAKKISGDIRTQLKTAGLHQNTYSASTELDYILARAWGSVDAGRKALVSQLARPRAEIDQMCDGLMKIPDDDYFRICFAYYEHLTPGAGCDTQVKLRAEVKLVGSDGKFKPKTDVSSVSAEIILGHELIHAWRMMKGRRIVNNGWEEEAMTTGCAPFRHLPITENALRIEGGFPQRPSYTTPMYNTTYGDALTF